MTSTLWMYSSFIPSPKESLIWTQEPQQSADRTCFSVSGWNIKRSCVSMTTWEVEVRQANRDAACRPAPIWCEQKASLASLDSLLCYVKRTRRCRVITVVHPCLELPQGLNTPSSSAARLGGSSWEGKGRGCRRSAGWRISTSWAHLSRKAAQRKLN